MKRRPSKDFDKSRSNVAMNVPHRLSSWMMIRRLGEEEEEEEVQHHGCSRHVARRWTPWSEDQRGPKMALLRGRWRENRLEGFRTMI